MHRFRNILTFALLLTLIGGIISPGIAVGQTPQSSPEPETGPLFVLRPIDGLDGGFFTVNAVPGSSTELTAVLGNAGSTPIELRTFLSDAVVLTNGGFGVKEEEAEQTGSTTWIDWEAETVEFAPGEGIERTFTVNVPEDAAPGEYIAGISLQTAEPIEVSGSTMFNQIIRKSIAVFIIVEGDTTASFVLGEPEILSNQGASLLQVPVMNNGDVLVKPAGTVTLTNAEGNDVFSADIAMGSVYAHMDTVLSIPIDNSLAGAEYEISLDLTDEASDARAQIAPQPIVFSGDIPEETQVQVTESVLAPMPDATEPVYAGIDLTISNAGDTINNANVVLYVSHNGEPVEEFFLATNTTLANGETNVSQRYIPAEGFTSGEWTFNVSIELVDPQSNATTVVIDMPLTETITVP